MSITVEQTWDGAQIAGQLDDGTITSEYIVRGTDDEFTPWTSLAANTPDIVGALIKQDVNIDRSRCRMIECRNLELHVAHGCNLSCTSCAHYSNHHHTGILSLATALEWLSVWSKRLRPRQFSLLGGEPALNPALTQFAWLAREMFPDSKLILVSNGFLLKRHPRLPVALRGTETALHISVHDNSDEYQRKLEPVRELIADWERRWGIDVNWRESFRTWTLRYRGFGKDMRPFDDGDPDASWRNCPAKWCLQLYEGKLWKCPAIAYLGMQDRKYGLGDEWRPYLAYEPLGSECTDTELREFVERQVEAVCGMCPARVERIPLIGTDHSDS